MRAARAPRTHATNGFAPCTQAWALMIILIADTTTLVSVLAELPEYWAATLGRVLVFCMAFGMSAGCWASLLPQAAGMMDDDDDEWEAEWCAARAAAAAAAAAAPPACPQCAFAARERRRPAHPPPSVAPALHPHAPARTRGESDDPFRLHSRSFGSCGFPFPSI